MPITDAKIRNAKPSGKSVKLSDSGGLYLEVRPSGSKLWRYRYRIDGKENVFALGEYHNDKRVGHVSLEDARRERDKARMLVKRGLHPTKERQRERAAERAEAASTFESVYREWFDKKRSSWSPYYARQIERYLQLDVLPSIGALPIRSITAADLLDLILRVEQRGAESVAILLRQWCSAIFRYAVSTLRADVDPAGALKGAVTRPKVQHSLPLSREQVATLLRQLENYGGFRTTVIGLQLKLLTFVRTIELRAATWEEINFELAEWRIPAARMKMREAHLVPLSRQSIELLRELHTLTGNQQWLFPNFRRPSTCMTATTLNRALERMGLNGKGGIGFSAHGFRSTASTILNEAGFRPDVIERQLAHKERNKTRASYNQAEYRHERREMMQQWADMVTSMRGTDTVTPFRRTAA